ncbi:MAG: hypothetical protein AAB840_01695 [Patescibacteria group bacterium]
MDWRNLLGQKITLTKFDASNKTITVKLRSGKKFVFSTLTQEEVQHLQRRVRDLEWELFLANRRTMLDHLPI